MSPIHSYTYAHSHTHTHTHTHVHVQHTHSHTCTCAGHDSTVNCVCVCVCVSSWPSAGPRASHSWRHGLMAHAACHYRSTLLSIESIHILYVSHNLRLPKKIFVRKFRAIQRWKAERETFRCKVHVQQSSFSLYFDSSLFALLPYC